MNGSRGVSDVFNSQYSKMYLSDDYHSFLKQQNIAFAWLVNLILENDLSLKKGCK